MSITRINSNLPVTTKISDLSDQILEIFGLVQRAMFSENDVSQLTTDFGLDRKYLRTQSLGHTLSTYTGWSHLHSESGYSIWSFSPTNYAYNIVNELYLDDVAFENRGLANSEAVTTFDKVFLDEGSVFTDVTTEAGTEDGVSFSLMNDASDYLYIGLSTTFAGVSFEFDVRGSNNTLYMEYWNGSSWTDLDISANTFVDDTSNFESDGRIYWTIPTNWATTTVNSVASKYWVRISTTTTPVTTAKAFLIQPANSVLSLLKMSSEEIFNEDWAWCSYGSSIYVTIRNAGVSAYEGNYYITSSSSSINKQNYFIHNHEFTADYQDSTYIQGSLVTTLDDLADVFVSSGLTDGQIMIWDSSMGMWRNADSSMEKTTLDSLKDVMVSSGLSNGQVLTWDSGDAIWRNASILETVSHVDLSDMPDTSGVNTDHDNRYWTLATAQTLITGNKTGSFDFTTSGIIQSEHLISTDDADINDNLTVGDIIIDESTGILNFSGITSASITATCGTIGFDNENITTTGTISGVNVTSGTNPGHVHTLDNLSDVMVSSGLVDNQVLTWDAGDSVWRNRAILENISHTDLSDMPDVGGTNSDHDSRYYTESETNSLLSNKQNLDSGLTSLAGLTYGSLAFVKYSAENTFTLDTTTYEPTLTKGNLSAGSSKISLSGSITNSLIGSGVTIDIGTLNLDDLTNVMVSSGLQDGQVLAWDSGDGIWRNINSEEITDHSLLSNLSYALSGHTGFEPTITTLSISKGGTNSSSLTQNKFLYFNGTSIVASSYYNTDFATSSHTHTLDELSDVSIGSGGPLAGQLLRYTEAYGWHNWTANYLTSDQIDDTKGDGDTTYIWSANKVYDQLALKANINSPTFTGTVGGITATMVGLSNVTNNAQYYAGGTDVAILDGGTGASLAQDAINNLTNVVAATNEYVLTKDTITGNATWKVPVGGSMSLDQLSDVMVSSGLIDGQGLYWDAGDAMWRNISPVEGVTSHPLLTSLDYASAGHTGFEQTLTFSQSLSRSVNTITLLNDSGTPGNTKYYGTDGSGTKGWYTLSTSSTLDSLTDVVVNSGITDKDILAWDNGDSVWRNRTISDLGLATLISPTFTGTPTLPTGTIATTQSASDNSTKLATTAYADAAGGVKKDGTVNPTNLLSNGDFENWSAGASAAPDGWALISATTARSTTRKSGSYGCEITADGSNAFHGAYYTISNFSDYKGEYVSASVWVYQSSGVAQTCTLRIYDGVGATNFEKSIPNTTWTKITGSVLVDASATVLWVVLLPTTGSSQTSSNIAVFDKVQLNCGESAFAFSDKPASEGVWADYGATSTIVGWSSFTTKQIYIKKIGKTVFVSVYLDGTSNDTVATFTLPYAISTGSNVNGTMGQGYDNGITLTSPGLFYGVDSTVTVCKTFVAGAWTNVNEKMFILNFWYESA